MRQRFSNLAASLLVVLAATGCGAMNDNPTNADKMQAIRQKESESRQNFHPTGAPPGAASPPPTGGAPASGAPASGTPASTGS